jgi:cytochrome c
MLMSISSQAISGEQLAKQKKCMACHHVTKKNVGPAFNQIAQKYSREDVAQLIKSVQEGSKGKWGTLQMPPQRVTHSEAEQIIHWILSNK